MGRGALSGQAPDDLLALREGSGHRVIGLATRRRPSGEAGDGVRGAAGGHHGDVRRLPVGGHEVDVGRTQAEGRGARQSAAAADETYAEEESAEKKLIFLLLMMRVSEILRIFATVL